MDSSIQKVLEPGWYPFGNYHEPNEDGFLYVDKQSSVEKSVYRLKSGQLDVSVSCIVGMNGSGKSTIIDIIYRIINNLAVVINEQINTPLHTGMEFAYGVNADLYCECDDYMNVIKCREENLKYFRYKRNSRCFPFVEEKLQGKYVNELLSHLFYTIGINYSLYAFNKKDYKSESIENINGEWLDGLFHKNDGYLSPLTLVPFRENGNISIEKEDDLAHQRIIALAILGRAKGKEFPEGYYSRMFHSKLNMNFKKEKTLRFMSKYQSICKTIELEELVDAFETAWKNLITQKKNIKIEVEKWDGSKEWELALFYLAYKSAKISLTYNDFYCNFTKEKLIDEVKAIVHELWRKNDHITLKIHQCLNYLTDCRWRDTTQVAVDELIENLNLQTYDDVIKILPPPFYDIDLTFIKKAKVRKMYVRDGWDNNRPLENCKSRGGRAHMEEVSAWSDDKGTTFKLSSMSSGEKQVLMALSYVLYHIKNIQSVNEANFRIPYHHINIVFDEVELYFHPDYQRRFLAMLIECLSWIQIDRRKIRSIHILIATHSPFILTDVLTERTLYLKEGKRESVDAQTFGANYYDLLANSFFFANTAIGEISSKALRRWIRNTEHSKVMPNQEVMNMIGDTFVKRYLETSTKRKGYVQD